MDKIKLLSEKQLEFIHNAEADINIAHGPVRSGKTVGSLFKFMVKVDECPDSQIWMIGHTSDSIFDNAIRLLLEPKTPTDPFAIFRPFLKWSGGTSRNLYYKDKVISTLGAKNEGMLGVFMGKTFSLAYADEITLYPDNIIDAIDSRLSNSYSKLYGTCNPNHPEHKIKKWIDKAKAGDKRYYELLFMLDDNPFLEESYKDRLKNSLSGLFFKRNYLGVWALAEGAIFDFFDTSVHVVKKPPRHAHYFICGIDYGTNHKFACTIVGVNTGNTPQDGVQMWAEAEWVWDHTVMGVQKTASEYAEEVVKFITPYGIQAVYVDPSALHFKLELQKRGVHCREANNDVDNGIIQLGNDMKSGKLQIVRNCPELIKEIQGYVWDSKKAKLGEDAPVKQNDHCFCAGTLISTNIGNVPIEQIKEGDLVYTRMGLRSVERTGHNFKKVKKFNIYGKEITCTADHKFFSQIGWVDIENLIQSDTLFTIEDLWGRKEHLKLFDSMDMRIDDIQILTRLMKEITSGEMENLSIENYGSFTTEKYPRDIIFITKTETPLTMIYPIWNALADPIMLKFMKKILNQIDSPKNPAMLLRNGINPKQEKNGIKNTPLKDHLENGILENFNVKYVIPPIQPPKNQQVDFVRINVRRNGEEYLKLIMNPEGALDVMQNFSEEDTPRHNIALAHVVHSEEKKQKVYNLTVDGFHEYFAEGFLVKNSIDSLRYAIHSHKPNKVTPVIHNPNDYQQTRFSNFKRAF